MGHADQGVLGGGDRYQLIPRTLSFVTSGKEVLLLRSAPDKRLWGGKYNGVGGHVERDEDIKAAARREILEETGLEVRDLRLCGVIHVNAGEQAGVGVFVFRGEAVNRDFRPSREGELIWTETERALTLELVPDLPVLLPKVLELSAGSEPFFARYYYDDHDRLVISFSRE